MWKVARILTDLSSTIFALALVAGFYAPQALAQQWRNIEDTHTLCLPTGPPPKDGYQPYLGGVNERGQKVIGGVPAYIWRHGCSPTAAGMVIGYWDGQGFSFLIPGDASTQTYEVDQAIASGDGADTHYSDYSLPLDSSPDPIQLDLSEPPVGDEHPSDCLADFMRTSWSAEDLYYGWSWVNTMDDALIDYTEWACVTYGAHYTASSSQENWGAFTWTKFCQEIDNDRPMVFSVDSDGNGVNDHSVTAIGYRDTNGYQEYACFDTWATGVRWERFRGVSGSYAWGIYAATYYSIQILSDGSIVAWGDNDYGQCNVPAPNTDFVAIATGTSHSLGLRDDGSIVAWGRNEDGQCNVPGPNAAYTAIAGGDYHSLAIRAGYLMAWGLNNYGQSNLPVPNTGFVAVAAGWMYSVGLKDDGSIVAWGRNNYGQCNVPAPNTNFVAVAAGFSHNVGLKDNGSIVAWGRNNTGQCNVPAPNAGFVAVSGGGFHSLGLKDDGSIVAWGHNDWGQCDVPAPNSDFVAVAAGDRHSVGLKADGSIVAWGRNTSNQCNVPEPNTDYVDVAAGAGSWHTLGLKNITPPGCPGDSNCDGVVNWRDIDFFVAAMNDNVAAWQAMFAPAPPPCAFANNDVNADGTVNWRDIDALVAVINTTCP